MGNRLGVLWLLWLALPAGSSFAQPPATTAAGTGVFPEPRPIERAAELAERFTREKPLKDGFFVETGYMITGSGWISAGPGYRRHVFGDRALASGSAAVSWRLYNMAHGGVDLLPTPEHPFSVGVGALYQDALQVNFFGVGNDTLRSSRSGYRLRSFDVDGHASYERGALTMQTRVGWLPMVEVRRMEGRAPAYPDTVDAFTDSAAPGLERQPSFAHADASVSWDLRDKPGRPTRGGMYTVGVATYRDLDDGRFSFRSAQLDAAQYVPIVGQRWVIALHGWSWVTDTAPDRVVPFYLLPNVGGKNTVRGLPDYRFHGPQMLNVSAESRVGIFSHVDAALFVDAGRVADRISNLRIDGMKNAVGAGVRFHTTDRTIARLDVAHSTEGWYLVFKLTEPFKRKTFAGDLPPAIPFVP